MQWSIFSNMFMSTRQKILNVQLALMQFAESSFLISNYVLRKVNITYHIKHLKFKDATVA